MVNKEDLVINKTKNVNKKPDLNQKNKIAVLFILLGLIFGVVAVLFFIGLIKLPNVRIVKQNKPCDDNIIKEYNTIKATAPLGNTWSKELSKIAEKIRRIEGYENDVNCLYIISQDHMEKHDWALAGYYFSQIRKIVSQHPNKRVSSKLTILSPEQLEKYLDYAFAINESQEGGR